MSIQVSDFKHVSGENDAEYIKLLQEHIDRQDAIIRKAVAKLKAAQPERKLGHWINLSISVSGHSSAECSVCGCIVHDNFSNAINYCPNCGAIMEGAE